MNQSQLPSLNASPTPKHIDIQKLEHHIEELEHQLAHITRRSWFFSDSLIKRSFAVLGHYTLASLIIAIPFYCLFFFLMSGPEGF